MVFVLSDWKTVGFPLDETDGFLHLAISTFFLGCMTANDPVKEITLFWECGSNKFQ